MELEIRDIRKSYGRKQVLRQVSMHAGAGRCTGIIGANGCGKSTLLKILAGIERADGGSIFVEGKVLKKPALEMARYTGYIPQESVLIPELTVEDNLKLWAGFGDYKENKKTLEGLCGQFQIREFYRERVKNLSGGMNKRVNIVCALIHRPSVLLMDEPSATLDLVFKDELKGYIRDFTRKGGSVLICSHDVGEIGECESLWAIRDGEAFEVPEKMTMTEIITEYMK